MIKELIHDPILLARKSEVATKEDLQLAQDLLITHRFALKDIEKAYEIFENKLDGVIKIAVTTE